MLHQMQRKLFRTKDFTINDPEVYSKITQFINDKLNAFETSYRKEINTISNEWSDKNPNLFFSNVIKETRSRTGFNSFLSSLKHDLWEFVVNDDQIMLEIFKSNEFLKTINDSKRYLNVLIEEIALSRIGRISRIKEIEEF